MLPQCSTGALRRGVMEVSDEQLVDSLHLTYVPASTKSATWQSMFQLRGICLVICARVFLSWPNTRLTCQPLHREITWAVSQEAEAEMLRSREKTAETFLLHGSELEVCVGWISPVAQLRRTCPRLKSYLAAASKLRKQRHELCRYRRSRAGCPRSWLNDYPITIPFKTTKIRLREVSWTRPHVFIVLIVELCAQTLVLAIDAGLFDSCVLLVVLYHK